MDVTQLLKVLEDVDSLASRAERCNRELASRLTDIRVFVQSLRTKTLENLAEQANLLKTLTDEAEEA